MDNSENQSNSDKNFRLKKNEIIKGHDSYLNVLQNSVSVSSDFLKAFVNIQSRETNAIDFTKSPLFTNNVKVGFVIAKKKIRKACFRNRIRRLLKESYRLNKNVLFDLSSDLNVLFSLTDNGYVHFRNNPKTKLIFAESEMKVILQKIKKKFTVK